MAKIGPARISGRSTMNSCLFFPLHFHSLYLICAGLLVDIEKISINYSLLPVYHLLNCFYKSLNVFGSFPLDAPLKGVCCFASKVVLLLADLMNQNHLLRSCKLHFVCGSKLYALNVTSSNSSKMITFCLKSCLICEINNVVNIPMVGCSWLLKLLF